ncbi:MAG TPA: zinc-finger domain-containing protein [Alphaproteobacteria bacterium]|nr:zinc-finger domain-containing protein [Alphaproteobacteria bacterium]
MAASNPLTPPETITVETAQVACDGGPLGHPRVYLSLEGKGEVECPYCDRKYVLKAGAKAHTH